MAGIPSANQQLAAGEQLPTEAANLRMLIEHTPAAIAMFDLNMCYLVASKRWLADYHLQSRDIIGRSHYGVFPEISERWKEFYRRGLAGETLRCDEDRFLRANGDVDWIKWELCPWYTQNGGIGGIILFTEDITERILAEQRIQLYAAGMEEQIDERTRELTETVLELEHARKELSQSLAKEKELGALKSRFVSMASHEFRTPLSAISLSASLIDKYARAIDNEPITRHAHKIKSAMLHLSNFLDDYLSLEKLEEGRVAVSHSDFDLVNFAEDLTNELLPTVKKGQTLIYSHTGINRMAHLDQNLLKQCVVNLVSNAINYAGENVTINFSTEINSGGYLITVGDNGIGIAEPDQKHLFDAFFRAHTTGMVPGTGLGLNLVKRYATLMDGEIEFSCPYGGGASFTLLFPLKS